MLMTDVEHRQRLIDADDLSALHLFGERPRYSPGAGCQIQNKLAAFQRQHFDQLLRQRAADAGHGASVEVRRMRRIMKARLVIV
jgi:hypothetical protein